MPISTKFLVLLFLNFSSTVSAKKTIQNHKRNSGIFVSALSTDLKLCQEIEQVNLKSPDFSPDDYKHIKDLEDKRLEITQILHSKEGVAFLKNELKRENDLRHIECIKKTISESN